jgi:hypothetical protein
MAPPSSSSTCRWHILGRSGDQTSTDTVDPGTTGECSGNLSTVTRGHATGHPKALLRTPDSLASQAIGGKWSKHRLLERGVGVRLRLYLLANSCLQLGLLLLLGIAVFRGRPDCSRPPIPVRLDRANHPSSSSLPDVFTSPCPSPTLHYPAHLGRCTVLSTSVLLVKGISDTRRFPGASAYTSG